ncbi:MAG: hypothetical protein GY696_07365 [Gammaproteobacteria bacterium]|nr:hypothetical protein [Gammaproteobacteria bacterium]
MTTEELHTDEREGDFQPMIKIESQISDNSLSKMTKKKGGVALWWFQS